MKSLAVKTFIWLSCVAHSTYAIPFQKAFSAGSKPHTFNPLFHLSGVAPYHDGPGAARDPPAGCKVSAAAYLIRHSSIYANDDEYDQTIYPFTRKLLAINMSSFSSDPAHPFYFLRHWTSPITDNNLEVLAPSGKRDATILGKRIRAQYSHLFPTKSARSHRDRGWRNQSQNSTSFKVWTASSSRDIESAKAFIQGAFPDHYAGNGTGNGKELQLIKVPNNDTSWAASLTPHKICAAFEKDSSRVPALQWLSVYAPRVRQRLEPILPLELASGGSMELTDEDILAMQLLCGYETVARGGSPWCDVMEREEWQSVGYYFDIRYHYMVGYGSKLSPYLGMPWLNSSTHLLMTLPADPDHPHIVSDAKDNLPPPELPPNGTHSQRLHIFFTHREEPALVLTGLGIWNYTRSSEEEAWHPPLDHIDGNRTWHTSHILPFLGHVALERLTCNTIDDLNLNTRTANIRAVRVIVNGAVQPLPSCQNGPEGSCLLDDFDQFIQLRMKLYEDIDGVCRKVEEAKEV